MCLSRSESTYASARAYVHVRVRMCTYECKRANENVTFLHARVNERSILLKCTRKSNYILTYWLSVYSIKVKREPKLPTKL